MIARTLGYAFILTAGALLATTSARTQSAEPVVYYFGAAGCDYCANGLAFLNRLKTSDQRLAIRAFDIVASPDDATAFVVVTGAIGLADPRIPMTIVGHHVFVGYEGEETTGEEIKLAVEQCRAKPCIDIVKGATKQGAQTVAAPGSWIVHRRFAKAIAPK